MILASIGKSLSCIFMVQPIKKEKKKKSKPKCDVAQNRHWVNKATPATV
jgi:hypothetical protein